MIARIIEFLPPNAAHKKGMRSTQTAAALAQANEVHVRVSLYYRPSDVSDASQVMQSARTLRTRGRVHRYPFT